MTKKFRFKKILLCLAVLLSLFFISAVSTVVVFKNNANFQSYIASKALNKEIALEGKMTFGLTPTTFEINLDNYRIVDSDTKKELLRFQSGDIVLGYWKWLFGSRNFKVFEMKDGFIDISDTLKPLTIITAKRENNVLTINGEIGSSQLLIKKDGDLVDVSLDNINLKAELQQSFSHLDDIVLTTPKNTIMGMIDIDGNAIDANINLKSKNTINVQIESNDTKDKMEIYADTLTYQDIQILTLLADELSAVTNKIMKPIDANNKERKESYYKIDISNFYKNDVMLGRINLKIEDTKEGIEILLDGTRLANAPLVGHINLNRDITKQSKIDLNLNGFDYIKLMKAFGQKLPIENKGNAYFSINITTKGNTTEEWKKAANGKIKLRANQAEFDGRLIELWGGGLVNFMIPSFGKNKLTQMNCAIIDIDIKDGVAKIEPLAVDTKRVTIYGKGQYNIPENKTEIRLKPESKGVSLGDIATAIKITGPLEKLSVSTDKLNVLKKVGGLALGVINPAFFAFSLTDIGLNAKNVCEEN